MKDVSITANSSHYPPLMNLVFHWAQLGVQWFESTPSHPILLRSILNMTLVCEVNLSSSITGVHWT
jgi:hypothetical protein